MKKPHFSLLHKALLSLFIILLPIVIAFIHSYIQNRAFLKEHALEEMTVVAEAFEGQVYQFLEMSKRRVQDFSSDGVINSKLEKILSGGQSEVKALSNYLSKHKLILDKTINHISIISLDGRVLASTDDSSIGKSFLHEPSFLKWTQQPNAFEYKMESSGIAEIALSAPIFSRATGKPIGIIVNFIQLSELSELLSGEFSKELGAVSWSKGRRKTLEVYLVNKDKLMLTQSLFIKDSILKQKVDTLPVQECLQANKETSAFYKDYRGIMVAGASMCLPSMGWTLLTEIDEDEILAPTGHMLRDTLIGIAVVAGLIFILFATYFRGVIRRIQTIGSASLSLAKGNYSVSIPVQTQDEVGALADMFNKMASEIKSRTILLDSIVNNSTTVIYVKDLEGKYILANRRFEELFKQTREQIIGKTDYDIFHKHIADFFRANDAEVRQAKIPILFNESMPQDDGLHYYISVKFPLFDQDGTLTATGGIATDITEYKKAEDIRLEVQQKYEDLVNNLNIGIYRRTADGKLLEANQALIKMFEADSKEEFLKHNLMDFYHSKERLKETNNKLLKHGFIKDEELEVVTVKGRKLWSSLSSVMKRDKNGHVYFDGIVEDITEKKRLEEQLRHAKKMEAVGQLAGGIAHDFNNILTAIIGYGSLLMRKKAADDMIKEYVGEMIASANRAATLTKDLLIFSRKHIINPQPADLNELVKRVGKILARVIGEQIEFKIDTTDKNMTVKMDTTQIEQVLMNLATNARDAMPKGGALTISTSPVRLDDSFIDTHSYGIAGDYALITVTDTGIGMDRETQSRIFEPFFTTKEVGKGTGLGLSTAYGVVKEHNGYINVYSEPGSGTTFKVYLPLVPEGVLTAKKECLDLIVPEGKSDIILVAEDEEYVRRVMKIALEEAGYRVIEAVTGEDALDKFTQNKDSINLVILDIIMPKKNGRASYEEIKKIKPDIKAIFISGYTADMIKAEDIVSQEFNLLSKPIAPNELLTKIREVMGT